MAVDKKAKPVGRGPRAASKAASAKTSIINVRMRPETKVQMALLAKQRDMSLSRSVEYLVEQELYKQALSEDQALSSAVSGPSRGVLDRIKAGLNHFFG